MSGGSCPWEAQSVVFYESRRLWELQIPCGGYTGWVRLKNLARARLRGLETLEAGNDQCLEDRGPGTLNFLYSTSLGGSRMSRF